MTVRPMMHNTRQNFLAGPGLAFNQHRHAAIQMKPLRPFHRLFHRWRGHHNFSRPSISQLRTQTRQFITSFFNFRFDAFAKTLGQKFIFPSQGQVLFHAAYLQRNFVQLQRFLQVIIRSGSQSRYRRLYIAKSSTHYHFKLITTRLFL